MNGYSNLSYWTAIEQSLFYWYQSLSFRLPFTNFCFLSPKIDAKRDDFNINVLNFPFLDGNDPSAPFYGVY